MCDTIVNMTTLALEHPERSGTNNRKKTQVKE